MNHENPRVRQVHQDIETLLNESPELASQCPFFRDTPSRYATVDAYLTEDRNLFIVEVDLPGLTSDCVHMKMLPDHALKIEVSCNDSKGGKQQGSSTTQTSESKSGEKKHHHRRFVLRERMPRVSFSRVIPMPERRRAHQDRIKANLEHGLLRVQIPLLTTKESHREIAVE